MGKINVLMVGNSSKVKGGITEVISQLLAHDWIADGVNMSFIPTYDGGPFFHKIVFFGKAYKRIIEFIKNDKPDIVHIHMSYKGSFTRKYMIYCLCKRYNIHVVLHMHGSEFENWFNSLNEKIKIKVKKMLKGCSAVIVLGTVWENVIKSIEPETKTYIIQNSVHIPVNVATWHNDIFQILFLGVLIPRKGVDDLIQAIKILTQEESMINIRVIIAGTGEDEEKLKHLTEKLGLNSVIDFVGWVAGEEKKKLFLESQLFILPSYNEGLPISVLEAISYGLPVIASDVGDVSSAVHDGENGYLIEPGDFIKLAEDVSKILDSKELFLKMSVTSRKIAEKEFSESLYFNKVLNCYRTVTE